MKFPDWVETKRMPKLERAQRRLRYLLRRVAVDATPGGTMKQMCPLVGIDPSSLSCAITRGWCSDSQAIRIADLVGKEHTDWRWLRYPLDVPAETA